MDLDVPADPWMRWTLLGLARHRHRQRWVADVLRTRLGTDLDRLARVGALGHPVPRHGTLPGSPDWTYGFHGRGCALTHRRTGERIDVDFLDASGEDLEAWFYGWYLDSLRSPERPEAEIVALHPSLHRTLGLTLQALGESGLLISGPRTYPTRLHPDVVANEAMLQALAEGEFPLARSQRASWLRNLLARGESGDALTAYAELDPPDLVDVLDEVLAGPISGRTSAALEVICARGDRVRVERLLARLDPGGPIPHPWLRQRATAWLRA